MDKGDDWDPIESVKVLEILEPSFPLSTTVWKTIGSWFLVASGSNEKNMRLFNVRFISYSKCSHLCRISKLSSKFGFIFAVDFAQAEQQK